MAFTKFMASTAGRALRIVAGIALLAISLFSTSPITALGWVGIVAGVVLVLVGAFNICLLAPLFGQPLSGRDVLAK